MKQWVVLRCCTGLKWIHGTRSKSPRWWIRDAESTLPLQATQILSGKLGLGQNIAVHTVPVARNICLSF